MGNMTLNYETLIKVTRSLSKVKDPETIIQMTVESVTSALGLKGCALFLMNRKSNELEVAASSGLSDDYLNKGTVSALHSIAASLKDGPVAVYDVSDDPRIQYPEAAQKEGIASILSVPIFVGDERLGFLGHPCVVFERVLHEHADLHEQRVWARGVRCTISTDG